MVVLGGRLLELAPPRLFEQSLPRPDELFVLRLGVPRPADIVARTGDERQPCLRRLGQRAQQRHLARGVAPDAFEWADPAKRARSAIQHHTGEDGYADVGG